MVDYASGDTFYGQSHSPDEDTPLGDTAGALRSNFEYGGVRGGADAERSKMWGAYADAIAGRQGPQLDTSQQDADLARAMAARQQQQQQGAMLQAQMLGGTTPQQQQLAQGIASAQGANQSIAASGTGLAAVAGAGRDAQVQNQGAALQGSQQMALQRALDMSSARDQYGQLLQAQGGQDVQQRGLAQQGAYQAAGLQDAQRARDDQMAQYYLQQRFDIGRQQLGAGMAYQQQALANYSGVSNMQDAAAERRQQYATQDQAALARAGGDAATAAATSAEQYDQNRKRGY